MARSDDPIDITFRPVGENGPPVEPAASGPSDARSVNIPRDFDEGVRSDARYWHFESHSNRGGCGCGCGCLTLIVLALLLLLLGCAG